jgi:peptide/nickel transport system substrate-binding protein
MRARRRPFATAILAPLVAVALAAACAPTGDQTAEEDVAVPSTPRMGGRLVVGTTAEVDGFLPTINRWSPAAFLIARAIYDPLATIDDQGEAQPYLAESFESNDDFTQWTIKLRPEISFHDGEPLNADALETHFRAAQASDVTTDAITPFAGYTVVDPLTLVIELSTPWAHLPVVMASQIGFIPSPRLYDEDNTRAASEPKGTGPFTFTYWKEHERVIVDRNPDYWRHDEEGRRLPYLSQIEFQPVPDDNQRVSRLRQGDLDVVHTESYREVSAFDQMVRDDPGGRLQALLDSSQGAEAGVVLNTHTGPFADRDLRRAAAYAIDRQQLIDDMFNGFYDIANGPFTAESKWGSATTFPTYFPERARQLVDDWRAANGGRAPVIRFTNFSVADSIPVAQQIAKWWTDVGFVVQLSNDEEKIASVTLVTGSFDAILLRHWDRPEPDAMYHFLIGDNIPEIGKVALNFPRYRSDVVNQALKSARGTDDEDFRIEQYHRVWNDFAENLPVLWLFHTRWAYAYQSRVHGIGQLGLPDGGRAEALTWGSVYLTGVWLD